MQMNFWHAFSQDCWKGDVFVCIFEFTILVRCNLSPSDVDDVVVGNVLLKQSALMSRLAQFYSVLEHFTIKIFWVKNPSLDFPFVRAFQIHPPSWPSTGNAHQAFKLLRRLSLPFPVVGVGLCLLVEWSRWPCRICTPPQSLTSTGPSSTPSRLFTQNVIQQLPSSSFIHDDWFGVSFVGRLWLHGVYGSDERQCCQPFRSNEKGARYLLRFFPQKGTQRFYIDHRKHSLVTILFF